MYRCVASCPELDMDQEIHCTVWVQDENDDIYKRFASGCPCGNIPQWVEIEDNVSANNE